MKFIALLFFVFLNQLCADCVLTEDHVSVRPAIAALLGAADKIDENSLDNAVKSFELISCRALSPDVLAGGKKNPDLRSAHIVWRFLAALMMTGNKRLIELHDAILKSGYEMKNDLLGRIGYSWSKEKMNEADRSILDSRFYLELSKGSATAPAFAAPGVFDAWKALHPAVTFAVTFSDDLPLDVQYCAQYLARLLGDEKAYSRYFFYRDEKSSSDNKSVASSPDSDSQVEGEESGNECYLPFDLIKAAGRQEKGACDKIKKIWTQSAGNCRARICSIVGEQKLGKTTLSRALGAWQELRFKYNSGGVDDATIYNALAGVCSPHLDHTLGFNLTPYDALGGHVPDPNERFFLLDTKGGGSGAVQGVEIGSEKRFRSDTEYYDEVLEGSKREDVFTAEFVLKAANAIIVVVERYDDAIAAYVDRLRSRLQSGDDLYVVHNLKHATPEEFKNYQERLHSKFRSLGFKEWPLTIGKKDFGVFYQHNRLDGSNGVRQDYVMGPLNLDPSNEENGEIFRNNFAVLEYLCLRITQGFGSSGDSSRLVKAARVGYERAYSAELPDDKLSKLSNESSGYPFFRAETEDGRERFYLSLHDSNALPEGVAPAINVVFGKGNRTLNCEVSFANMDGDDVNASFKLNLGVDWWDRLKNLATWLNEKNSLVVGDGFVDIILPKPEDIKIDETFWPDESISMSGWNPEKRIEASYKGNSVAINVPVDCSPMQFSSRIWDLLKTLGAWRTEDQEGYKSFMASLNLNPDATSDVTYSELERAIEDFMKSGGESKEVIYKSRDDIEKVLARLTRGKDLSQFNPLEFYKSKLLMNGVRVSGSPSQDSPNSPVMPVMIVGSYNRGKTHFTNGLLGGNVGVASNIEHTEGCTIHLATISENGTEVGFCDTQGKNSGILQSGEWASSEEIRQQQHAVASLMGKVPARILVTNAFDSITIGQVLDGGNYPLDFVVHNMKDFTREVARIYMDRVGDYFKRMLRGIDEQGLAEKIDGGNGWFAYREPCGRFHVFKMHENPGEELEFNTKTNRFILEALQKAARLYGEKKPYQELIDSFIKNMYREEFNIPSTADVKLVPGEDDSFRRCDVSGFPRGELKRFMPSQDAFGKPIKVGNLCIRKSDGHHVTDVYGNMCSEVIASCPFGSLATPFSNEDPITYIPRSSNEATVRGRFLTYEVGFHVPGLKYFSNLPQDVVPKRGYHQARLGALVTTAEAWKKADPHGYRAFEEFLNLKVDEGEFLDTKLPEVCSSYMLNPLGDFKRRLDKLVVTLKKWKQEDPSTFASFVDLINLDSVDFEADSFVEDLEKKIRECMFSGSFKFRVGKLTEVMKKWKSKYSTKNLNNLLVALGCESVDAFAELDEQDRQKRVKDAIASWKTSSKDEKAGDDVENFIKSYSETAGSDYSKLKSGCRNRIFESDKDIGSFLKESQEEIGISIEDIGSVLSESQKEIDTLKSIFNPYGYYMSDTSPIRQSVTDVTEVLQRFMKVKGVGDFNPLNYYNSLAGDRDYYHWNLTFKTPDDISGVLFKDAGINWDVEVPAQINFGEQRADKMIIPYLDTRQ